VTAPRPDWEVKEDGAPRPARRRHHRAKQARGWQLTQPEPGTMVWITPSGRSYATGPTVYPV
jgi:hypothetical protein